MGLGDRMLQALKDAGISQAEIARRLGVTPQAVYGWITTGTISKKRLVHFARETGADLASLMSDREDLRVEAMRGQDIGSLVPTRREQAGIPLIGHVIATPDTDGFFEDMGFPPGAGELYIPWATRDPNAYAVRVRGDSMYPRYRPGEILVVEPNAAVVPGEDVVVRTRDGRKMVKRLLFQRSGEVELGSINERHKPITIALEQIESMQLVAGSVRSGGGRE